LACGAGGDALLDCGRAKTRAARQNQQAAYDRVGEARTALSRLEQHVSDSRNRLVALREEMVRINQDTVEAQDRLSAADQAQAVLEDAGALRERLGRLRTTVAEMRAKQVEKRSAFDQLARDAKARGERLAAIAAEDQSWRSRADGANRRLADLEQRRLTTGRDLTALEARPDQIAEQQAHLRDTIANCEAERQKAADRLAEAEAAQRDMDHALRAAEVALAEAREHRVRRESAVEQAMQVATGIAERVREKLHCAPEAALAPSRRPSPGAAGGGRTRWGSP